MSSDVLLSASRLLVDAHEGNKLASIDNEQLVTLFAAVIKVYAAKVDEGEKLVAFRRSDDVSATAVVVTATAMLAAAEIAVFELGMWQTIKGKG